MKRLLLFLTIICLLFSASYSQNPSFSHFDWNLGFYNPAAIASTGLQRYSTTYNHRWISNTVTNSVIQANFESPVLKNKFNQVSVASNLTNERSSFQSIYNVFQFSIGGSYAFKISKNTQLSFGLSGTYFSERFENNGLLTGSQFIPGLGFDPSLPNNEPFSRLVSHYFGISTGLLLYNPFVDHIPENFIGIGLKNLNRPVNSLFDIQSRLQPQINISAGHRIVNVKKAKILIDALYSITNNKGSLIFGPSYITPLQSFYKYKEASARINVRYASVDMVQLGAQLILDRMVFGLQYELRLGQRNPSYENGFELYFALNNKIRNNWRRKLKYKRRNRQIKTKEQAESSKSKRGVALASPDSTVNYTETDSMTIKDHAKNDIQWSAEVGDLETDEEIRYKVYFEFSKESLTEESINLLKAFTDLFAESGKSMIVLTGHTDDVGNENYNLQLSISRANSVKQKLVELGISPSNIITRGKGESEPLVPNDSEENRAKNRRVEITFY